MGSHNEAHPPTDLVEGSKAESTCQSAGTVVAQNKIVKITGSVDKRTGKRERVRLFKALAARCANSVKSMYPDMQDCYSASAALVEVLRMKGFLDARSLGCSVVVTDGIGSPKRVGFFDVQEKPSHQVVIVSGVLIDATIGQYRAAGLSFPDYHVFDNCNVPEVLELNRSILGVNGPTHVHYFRVRSGIYIAYIPTDPSPRHETGPY